MTKKLSIRILFLLFLIISCSKKDIEIQEQETINFSITTDDEINHFIWRGLNLYYLWQENVPNLADTKFTTLEELYTYFRRYSSPDETFNNLLYQPSVKDRFSWIVDDYEALENSFQGINLSTGMEFSLVKSVNSSTNIFGYVRYVIPNSNAATKGVKRATIFNFVNGTQLTIQNYRNLLFGENTSFSIGLADYNSGVPVANGTTIQLTKSEIQENPIAVSKVIPVGGKKIGYLLYNQFASSYDIQLNATFNFFKSENIDELIIDLRYNGGGSVRSATYLGSMVTGQFVNQIYSKEKWNAKATKTFSPDSFINKYLTKIKVTDANGAIISEEDINSLGLNRVYFIVSGSTASASELVINSLNAYIDVKVVGSTTVGKQVGSMTLYDSKNLRRNGRNLNTKHTYAIQPLVLEITDKNGVNYPNGIRPGDNFTGIELEENLGDLGDLGKRSDPLLNRTLNYIFPTEAKRFYNKEKVVKTIEIFNSKLATPASNNMYSEFE